MNLSKRVALLALKWKHSVVESADTSPGLPHLVICYSQNVERNKAWGTYYICVQFGVKQNAESN